MKKKLVAIFVAFVLTISLAAVQAKKQPSPAWWFLWMAP